MAGFHVLRVPWPINPPDVVVRNDVSNVVREKKLKKLLLLFTFETVNIPYKILIPNKLNLFIELFSSDCGRY